MEGPGAQEEGEEKEMNPLEFPEQTTVLAKPSSMTEEECGALGVHQTANGEQCISCWTCPIWERIKFLFHGKIWVGVLSGKTQPPIWLCCIKSAFKKEK